MTLLDLLPLILLGIVTYFIVQRSVNRVTQTPVWLLWLVMMTPALTWSLWTIFFGVEEPLPMVLVVMSLLICSILYWGLVQRGRRKFPPSEKEVSPSSPPQETPQDSEAPKETPRTFSLTQEDEKNLRNCFPWGVYYLQNIDYRPQAVLCRGKLRSNSDLAYKTIRENITQKFGDRFLIVFQEGFRGQPFFALVPNRWAKSQKTPSEGDIKQPGLAIGLFFITFFTTAGFGATLVDFSSEPLPITLDNVMQGLPYSLAILAIFGIREVLHYLTASFYQLRTSFPLFIPFPFFLGTLGAFIQLRSPIPNRKALFDISIISPLSSFIIALPCLIWGLSQSTVVDLLPNESGLFNFQSLDPRGSLLLAVLSKLALGSALSPDHAISLSPLAVAGYIGLIITALNLMPIGQLEGGHIVHAIYGQRPAIVIGQITRLLMFVLSLIQREFLLWVILLFFMPVVDEPTLNDVSELNNWRDFIGLLALTLLIVIILPLPGSLAQWLTL